MINDYLQSAIRDDRLLGRQGRGVLHTPYLTPQ